MVVKMLRGALLPILLMACLSGVASAKEKSLATSVTIEPGKWSVGRLRNVNDGVVLEAGLTSDQPVVFMILDEASYNRFPQKQSPLVLAQVHERAGVQTVIAKGGNYFLLFWNKGDDMANVSFFARVSRP